MNEQNNRQLTICKTCGTALAKNARSCPHCGAKNKKTANKIFKIFFIPICIIFLLGIIYPSDASSSEKTSNKTNENSNNTVITNSNDDFAGDIGISASAELGTDIIGQPTINISVTNVSNKDIAAIQFYVIPYDVYGEELTGIFTQNKLYTNDIIKPGSSTSTSWQMLDSAIKNADIYVYSVYFDDGTEWGNREATKSTILKEGMYIEIN